MTRSTSANWCSGSTSSARWKSSATPTTSSTPACRPLPSEQAMTAAIYARKSTDQSGVSDDQRSVARQVEHATAYASGKGWTVLDEHVYVDDGISGAEFANRPGQEGAAGSVGALMPMHRPLVCGPEHPPR
jgi:hypothetical protein